MITGRDFHLVVLRRSSSFELVFVCHAYPFVLVEHSGAFLVVLVLFVFVGRLEQRRLVVPSFDRDLLHELFGPRQGCRFVHRRYGYQDQHGR